MITTHVLDLAHGTPASGVRVTLERVEAGARATIGEGVTDADGRLRTLVGAGRTIAPGTYQLTFATGDYFAARDVRAFHPTVTVAFHVADGAEHYHVPLLVSPFGYTTYRGS